MRAGPPAIPHRFNRLERGDRLVTVLGQFNAQDQMERVYSQLSFDVYYHQTSDDWTPPSISDVEAQLTGGHAQITVSAEDDSGIEAVVVVYTDGKGVWTSTSLTLSEGKWSGSFPVSAKAEFVVQVVDQAGNVATSHNDGDYFELFAIYLPVVLR